MAVRIGKSVKIYPGVKLGNGCVIYDFVVLGFPPRNKMVGAYSDTSLQIGENAIIRPFTTIYAGNRIGDNFQSGQGTSIREDNIIGNNVSVGSNTTLEFGNRIGSGTRIHSLCFLELVNVGENVFIGPGTVFLDDPHPMNCPRYRECLGGAKVKKLVKIGGGCIILPGITIGEAALIGAGTCVTKDVPKGVVVVGHPGKFVKKIEELKCYPGFFKRPYLWKPYI
ncbi:transferase [candidate division WOR-3 bacterium]|nr:transferase [candidate division WOR-3 bacterium]